jgi:hypothetical protein
MRRHLLDQSKFGVNLNPFQFFWIHFEFVSPVMVLMGPRVNVKPRYLASRTQPLPIRPRVVAPHLSVAVPASRAPAATPVRARPQRPRDVRRLPSFFPLPCAERVQKHRRLSRSPLLLRSLSPELKHAAASPILPWLSPPASDAKIVAPLPDFPLSRGRRSSARWAASPRLFPPSLIPTSTFSFSPHGAGRGSRRRRPPCPLHRHRIQPRHTAPLPHRRPTSSVSPASAHLARCIRRIVVVL